MLITTIASLAILVLLTLIATGILILPIARYLRVGWFAKRAEILYALSDESRLRYFEMFQRQRKFSLEQAHNQLKALYTRWYGRRLYISPLFFLTVTALIVNYLCISSALAIYADGISLADGTIRPRGFVDLAWIPVGQLGIAAQAGAYMWVVNDFTSRARRLDFAPSDVHWGVLRLAIALPLGCFASQIFPVHIASWHAFVAFGFGAFPLSSLLSLFRRLFLLRLGLKDNPATDSNIIKLQGVNAGIAERLENEDITTISQLAYCDPIRITMRSSLSFNFIVDCMNQALAWVYLEGRMNIIRPFGLRGAIEISHLHERLNSEDANTRNAAVTALHCVEVALRQDKATLAIAFSEIAQDPFTEYLSSIRESLEKNREAEPQPWQRTDRQIRSNGAKRNGLKDVPVETTESAA